MNVLVVSGIWPPDVGGPASHAPEVASFLADRGHHVEAVITADARPAPRPYPVHWVDRSLPVGLRHVRALGLIAARARAADVVYTTGIFGRSSAACALTRTAYVLKLTGDSAYERVHRLGLYRGSLAAFQDDRSVRTLPFRLERASHVRRAAHVVCPSAYLRELVLAWGAPPERVTVLPNPAPRATRTPARAPRTAGVVFAFAGRLTAQKDLGVAVRAVAAVPDAMLVVAGEGPDRPALEQEARRLGAADRVRFLGAQPRERVLELFAGADAALLPSAWENFPHTVVEALAVGTPVVATDVGGVAEAVADGVNGLLVRPGDEAAFAGAVARFAGDGELRARLAAAAAPSVERFSAAGVFGELEAILRAAAA